VLNAVGELHRRICEALRGNRAPVVAELLLPDGTHKVIQARKQSTDNSGNAKTEVGPA